MSGLNSFSYRLRILRVDAIGGDDQVGIGEFKVGVDLALEHELHPELFAAFLQNVEQFLAADADKAVAGGAHASVLDPDLDVVPMVERGRDRFRGLAVPGAHILHVASEKTTPQPNVS